VQVEVQVEIMQVAEHLQTDAPDRAFTDPSEQRVAQLVEDHVHETCKPVGQDQQQRYCRQCGQCCCGFRQSLCIERIDDVFQEERQADGGELRQRQTAK